MNRARADDSMMLVRLNTNPIKVRNTRAVRATPRSVEDNGEDAVVGYALTAFLKKECNTEELHLQQQSTKRK